MSGAVGSSCGWLVARRVRLETVFRASAGKQRHERRRRQAARGILLKLLTALALASACFLPLDADGAEASFQIDRNLAYANLSSAQKLDLYRPLGRRGALPLVIYIHGGGFRFGSKAGAWNLIGPLLKAGFAVASIDYRLSGEARFPAQIVDVKAAVRFLRADATRYRLDPHRFGAFGGSAGGYLATMLAVTAGAPAFADARVGGSDGSSSSVQAAVDWFGPVDFLSIDAQRRSSPPCLPVRPKELSVAGNNLLGVAPASVPASARRASPISYLASAHAVPSILIEHGSADCRVPPQQSRELYRALRASGHGGSTRIVIVAGAGHGPRFGTVAQMPAVIRFFRKQIGNASATTGRPLARVGRRPS